MFLLKMNWKGKMPRAFFNLHLCRKMRRKRHHICGMVQIMGKNIFRRLCLLLALVLCFTHLTGCALLYTSYQMEDKEMVSGQTDGLAGETSADGSGSKVQAGGSNDSSRKEDVREETEAPIDEDGEYYSKDEVALYIYTYQKLPSNYITKKEAQALGWEGGAVEKFAPGKVIGGDRFGNYEGLLPEKNGRSYTECDIDTKGKSRGAKRIVFSNDGLIYYTDDHYESFTLLYGEE